jgi:hypothetical protein
LACAGVLVIQAKMGRLEEAVVSEQEAEEWFNDQELPLFGKEFIVQARTIAWDDEGEKIQTWMKIEHVYYGPEWLKNSQFLVVSPKEHPQGGRRSVVYPAPNMNDVGIWRLHVHKNRLFASPGNIYVRRNRLFVDQESLFSFGEPIPAFQKDGDDYETALSFSKAVEEVSKLRDRRKQLSRLEQLALAQDSEIAYWATKLLANEKPDGIADFFRGLIANEKSTIAAQVIADKALMELDPKAWQHSNERIAMVNNWVHGKSSLRVALHCLFCGLGHMDIENESFGIGRRKLLNFLCVAVLNEDIPSDERLGILRRFRNYSIRFKGDAAFQDEVFQVLANVALKSKDQAIKLQAAQILATEFSLESKTRQTLLRELMESAESGEGGRYLRQHLDIDAVD